MLISPGHLAWAWACERSAGLLPLSVSFPDPSLSPQIPSFCHFSAPHPPTVLSTHFLPSLLPYQTGFDQSPKPTKHTEEFKNPGCSHGICLHGPWEPAVPGAGAGEGGEGNMD